MSLAVDSAVRSDFRKLFGEALQFREKKEYEPALKILRHLAKLKPQSASVHGILGEVHWRLGQLQQAVRSFKRATELSPTSELASLGLFHTLWEAGKSEEAKEEMKRYMAVGNSDEYMAIARELFPNANSSLDKKGMKKTKRHRPNGNDRNSLRRMRRSRTKIQ